jgi:hypothetical protein
MGDARDAEHLLAAMRDCQIILATFVGIPTGLTDESGTISEFDPEKREMVTTDRSRVPEIAWCCAIQALDLLSIGVGLSEGESDLIDEAQAFLARKEST